MVYKLCHFFNTKNKLDKLNINIHELLDVEDDQRVLQLIEPLDVRFCSYEPAIKRLCTLLAPVLETLTEIYQ